MPTKRKRPALDYSDPYTLLDSLLFPGYAERLRQLCAFDSLNHDDAQHVVAVIMSAQTDRRWRGIGAMQPGPQEPRDARVALQQHAANVGSGCDPRRWNDRSDVSTALGIAATALDNIDGWPTGNPDRHTEKTPSVQSKRPAPSQ